jgi:hypothetical protein
MYEFAKGGRHAREKDDRGLQFKIQSVHEKDISGLIDYGVGSNKYAFRMRPVSDGKKSEIRDDIIDRIQRGGSQ